MPPALGLRAPLAVSEDRGVTHFIIALQSWFPLESAFDEMIRLLNVHFETAMQSSGYS
jgi:hypothetical protein